MKRSSLRYILLTSRFEQVWFPLSFWMLFIIIGLLRGSEYILDTTRAYLGATIPLIGGIMAAYAVLDDPALELRFGTPIPAAQTLLERLAPTFAIQALSAFTYQGFALLLDIDFSPIGGWGNVQLAWLVPTFTLMAFGCLAALLTAQTTAGAALIGMVWIVQLVARGWFAANKVGQYFLVFMSPLMPEHPALRANQIMLGGMSLIFLFASWMLFLKQERYI